MDEILMLSDHADDARAIKFAHQFALQNGKELVMAQVSKFELNYLFDHEAVMSGLQVKASAQHDIKPQIDDEQFHPPLKTIDVSCFDEEALAAHIREQGYAIVISKPGFNGLNLQTLVNQINCPLMLLPDNLTISEVKRIVYLTDLRYCQQQVISYLNTFKRSSVLLAHVCEKGLPDLAPSYGDQLFHDTIRHHVAEPEMFFSHIKESNVEKMVDTLVSTMKTDVLVCLNRRTHFQQLLGEQVPERLPEHISVPLLIFPC